MDRGGAPTRRVLLLGFFQLPSNLLEEDFQLEVVLHQGLAVTHTGLVEVLDLGQHGEGDDVASLADALRLGLSILPSSTCFWLSIDWHMRGIFSKPPLV